MKKIYLVGLLIIIASTVALGQRHNKPKAKLKAQTTQAAKWNTFSSEYGEFRIEFPVEPTRGNHPAGLLYEAVGPDAIFTLAFQKLWLNPNDRDDALAMRGDIYTDFAKRVLEYRFGTEVQILATTKIKRGIAETEYWQGFGQEKVHRFRRDIVGNSSLTTLHCSRGKSNEKADAKVCSRFFNSFRFTGKTQNVSRSTVAARVCPICHGSGHTIHTGTCQRCNGFGTEEDGEICHVCRGTRMQVGVKKTCQRCNGAGRIR